MTAANDLAIRRAWEAAGIEFIAEDGAVLASVFVHLGIKRKLEHSLPDQEQPPSRGSTFSIVTRSHNWDSQRPTRHSATALNRAVGRIAFWG